MGLFDRKKDAPEKGGKYSLKALTPGEKNAVLNLFNLTMQGPEQTGLKGQALKNARCTSKHTYGQLEEVKKHVQSDSLSAEDVQTVSFVLTSGSFAVGQLVEKLQKEKVGGERLARAMILLAGAKAAKQKVDGLLKKQDNAWESF